MKINFKLNQTCIFRVANDDFFSIQVSGLMEHLQGMFRHDFVFLGRSEGHLDGRPLGNHVMLVLKHLFRQSGLHTRQVDVAVEQLFHVHRLLVRFPSLQESPLAERSSVDHNCRVEEVAGLGG